MTLLAIAGDVLRLLLGAMFVWYGYFDVRPSPARKEEFLRWGFPSWVQPAGGVLQLVSVALLVVPTTVSYGAIFLLAMMVFSVYVHLVREHRPAQVPWPVILGILALITAFLYGSVALGPAGIVFRAWFG